MGDFNLTPESKEYQKMNEYFQSSHQVFYKKEPQIAFPTGLTGPYMNTDPTGTFDYIWLRGENIEVKDFQIFGDNKIEEGVYPSDHYGLLRNLNLKFSRELKGEVTLEGDDLIAHGNQFALCNQTTTNEGIQFAFSPKQGDYVSVGACHKDIIKKNNFQVCFQKDQINHEAYLISSYGYAWSHNQQKYNGGKLSFKYDSNDIVIVQIDKKLNRIRWIVVNKNDKKEKGQKQQVEQTYYRKFSMRIDPNLDLTPCVYLLYDSSVEIVNDFERYL